MLEYEKKILLSQAEYSALLTAMCKDSPACIQTNYYFDTDDFSMNEKGVTCRIRCKNGKFKTTVKSHGGKETDCSVENCANIKNKFDADTFKEMGLHLQGSLFTERTVAYKDEFCEAVLDSNTYLGNTDYELEIEYSQEYNEYADNLLFKIAGILLTEGCITNIKEFCDRAQNPKSKSQRFFERKKTILSKGNGYNEIYI